MTTALYHEEHEEHEGNPDTALDMRNRGFAFLQRASSWHSTPLHRAGSWRSTLLHGGFAWLAVSHVRYAQPVLSHPSACRDIVDA